MITAILSLFLASSPTLIVDYLNSLRQEDIDVVMNPLPIPIQENNEKIVEEVRTALYEAGLFWLVASTYPDRYLEYQQRGFAFYSTRPSQYQWPEEGYFVSINNLKIHKNRYQNEKPEIFLEEDYLNRILLDLKLGMVDPNLWITQIAENKYEYEYWLKHVCIFCHLILDGDFSIQKYVKIKDRIISENEKIFWRTIFEKTPAKAI